MVAASSAGREHGHDDEHDELDRGRWLGRFISWLTAVPRAIGPNSSVARSGTSSAGTPITGATSGSTTSLLLLAAGVAARQAGQDAGHGAALA